MSVQSGAIATVSRKSIRCSCAVAAEGHIGHAHNEEAFRYLLAVERKRATRGRRSLLLLLISLKKQPSGSNRIDPDVADSIFSSLWLSVREVDFIGWFREARVAGAVLAQGAHSPEQEVARRVGKRITETLRGCLPEDIACRLHVRVLQFPSPDATGSVT
jgi:hypothetical protein